MNPATHKFSGRFCPFCLRPLWLHIESGFEFCPGDPECDYEVRPSTTLHPLTQAEKVERSLKNKQREHSVMLKRLGELQVEIARLTSEMTELGFPQPAGGPITGGRIPESGGCYLVRNAGENAPVMTKKEGD